MAASNEFTEWHLTPDGWVRGSYQTDFSSTHEVEPPANRLLSVRVEEEIPEIVPGEPVQIDKDIRVIYRSDDEDEEIQALIAKYGDKNTL